MPLGVNMNNQIKRPNPKFTLEFKQDAVKLTTEKGYTHRQVADSLGISLSAVGRWSRAERGSSISSGAKTATLNLAGQAGLLRPRKGNGQLRMGREIIKKAAAFPSASPGQALPRKSDKARVYPGATEGPANYRVMPRDGSECQCLLCLA
jgi:transposase